MRNALLQILFFSFFALQIQAAPPLWEADNNVNSAIPSITNTDFNNDIKVYPNPATEYIMVSENNQIDKVMIYNVLGKLVKTFDAESHKKYQIGDLPKGMYVVRLLDSENKLIKTRRITKRNP